MSIAPTDIVAIPRGVRLHEDKVRGNSVLLAPERAIGLSPVSLAILTAIDGERSFEALTEHLAAQFKAPIEEIAKDCDEFITALLDRRILELNP